MKRIVCLLLVNVYSGALAFSRETLINHVEGTAFVNGAHVSNNTAILADGAVLNTGDGRVEILLNPGVFLRVGKHSSLTIISRTPTLATLKLTRGKALIEVVDSEKDDIQVSVGQCSFVPAGPGLYETDADERRLQVYEGHALMQCPSGNKLVRRGYERVLANTDEHGQLFDARSADGLYAWSASAAEYEAEASYNCTLNLKQSTVDHDAWYWSPQLHCWAFVPRSGIVSGSFGWAFPAPAELRRALIVLGPAFHYPAAADRNNLPRIFPLTGSGSIKITSLRRISPPASGPSIGMSPGVPMAPIFIPH